MRLLPFLLLLAACADAPAVIPERDAEADRLLAFVAGDAWDGVWDAASGGAYTRTADGAQAAVDSFPNPLPAFISDEPPYLDASARDQYATRVLGDTVVAGRTARLVEARFVADGRRTQPIRYVRAAVSPEAGALLAVEVQREMASALFDETSRLRASLASGENASSGARGLVPGAARIDARTDVPLSDPRASRIEWARAR